MRIKHSDQQSVLRRDTTEAGSADVDFIVQSDSVLTTLFAEVLTGTLDVSVYAITVGGPADPTPAHEVLLYSFPQISAPSADLLIQTAAATTERVRVKAVWTGEAKFDIQARAINGGTSTTRVVTAGSVEMDQTEINTGTPQIIIPASLQDSVGFMLRNWSSNGAIIYVAETEAKAVPAKGWPLGPGDVIDVSVKAGQAYYASSTVDGADLRIVKGGQ